MDVQTILAFGSNKLGMDAPLSIPVRGCEPSWGNCRGSMHMQPDKDAAELFKDGFFSFFLNVVKQFEMKMEIFSRF